MDQKKINPEFLCDYLRKGFGAEQISRLHTGSTGLIELQPHDVDRIIIPPLPSYRQQQQLSFDLRKVERETNEVLGRSLRKLAEVEEKFYQDTLSL